LPHNFPESCKWHNTVASCHMNSVDELFSAGIKAGGQEECLSAQSSFQWIRVSWHQIVESHKFLQSWESRKGRPWSLFKQTLSVLMYAYP
jgi:hypothetical protein